MFITPTTRVVSLCGLASGHEVPWGTSPRDAIEWLASAGARSIVLDGARDGLRARQLDGTARRGLASLLKRLGLSFDGIDLWIPPGDLCDPIRAERALDAACDAITLAADLHRAMGARGLAPAINIALPASARADAPARDAMLTTDARATLRHAAHHFGVPIADFGPDAVACVAGSTRRQPVGVASAAAPTSTPTDAPRASAAPHDDLFGVGLDPAALLRVGVDPVAAAASCAAPVLGARLPPASALARALVAAPGMPQPDLAAYRAVLMTRGLGPAPALQSGAASTDEARAGRVPLVIDLRGEPDPAAALRAIIEDAGSPG